MSVHEQLLGLDKQELFNYLYSGNFQARPDEYNMAQHNNPEWLLKPPADTAEARNIRLEHATVLTARLQTASRNTGPDTINPHKIEDCLRMWLRAMGRPMIPIVQGSSKVRDNEILGSDGLRIRSETKSTGVIVHEMTKIANEALSRIGWRDSPGHAAMAVTGRHLMQAVSFREEGIGISIIQLAALAIGAAALPSMKHYAAYYPLLEAFENGCIFAWYSPSRVKYITRPIRLLTDVSGRPHNESGPAVTYWDGTAYYYWHGTHVPMTVITTPVEKIDAQRIMLEENIENRRVLLERWGEENLIKGLNLRAVDHHDKFGTLYLMRWEEVVFEELEGPATLASPTGRRVLEDWRNLDRRRNGRPICRLKVINRTAEPDGTFRVYWLPINPDCYDGEAGRNAHAAAASTWRTTPGGSELFFRDWRDYDPRIET